MFDIDKTGLSRLDDILPIFVRAAHPKFGCVDIFEFGIGFRKIPNPMILDPNRPLVLIVADFQPSFGATQALPMLVFAADRSDPAEGLRQ